jgi:hypothetical protein
MLVYDQLSVYSIAGDLNRRGSPYRRDSAWDYQAVYGILTHPKYAGCNVFGRTSSRLYAPSTKIPKSDWILTHRAFEPIVDQLTFLEAQRLLADRTINKSDEELLESLRVLLVREGRLSLRLIKNSPDTPSPSTYRHRFGSLRRAYELIGYGRPRDFDPIDLRRRTQALREELLCRLEVMFPTEVSILRQGGRWRSYLQLEGGVIVTVVVARSIVMTSKGLTWQINPVAHERLYVTLLALLDGDNSAIQEMFVFPCMDRTRRFHVATDHIWLKGGEHLKCLSQFLEAVKRLVSQGH